MARWEYTKGLKDIGNGQFAWLQPDGGWGWSNAGLIVDGEASLLVDTLFDMKLTDEMLRAMKDAAGVAGADIGIVVNTHANGDHCHGNGCCPHAEIIASEASAAEMRSVTPEMLAGIIANAEALGEAGAYFKSIFGMFDFAHVEERLPTQTFSGKMQVQVGNRAVQLIEVGPAHTAGDVLVHVPDASTIYTGDILFIEGTPIMWAGPVSNWIEACDQIIALNPEVIVPGHGPITDLHGVRRVQDYLRYIDGEARKRFEDGLSLEEAIQDISLGDFANWGDAERIAVNVSTLYREYEDKLDEPADVVGLFGLMAKVKKAQRH